MKLMIRRDMPALLGVLLCACSSASSDAGSDASTDGSSGGDGGAQGDASAQGDGSADGSTGDGSTGACNSLVNETATIAEEIVLGDPPAATGGTIADGTYFLTRVQTYVGDGGSGTGVAPSHRAWQISGNTLQIVRRFFPFSVNNPDHHHTETFQASGTSLTTVTLVCTDPTDTLGVFNNTPYSVNGSDLVVFQGPETLATFAKQ